MVKIKLIKKNNSIARYYYMPEGKKTNPGVVEYDFRTKEARLVKLAGEKWDEYWGHALKLLRGYGSVEKFPETDASIWY